MIGLAAALDDGPLCDEIDAATELALALAARKLS